MYQNRHETGSRAARLQRAIIRARMERRDARETRAMLADLVGYRATVTTRTIES